MELDFFKMAMWLMGGLALFLFGMDQMVKGLLVVAGDRMKALLATLTTNRVSGALTGAGVTAVIQSSSVTTVLTVGFVSAGLMSVTQAASVIMGANLGTTITAQIVAFKITHFALLMIAVGFFMQFMAKNYQTKGVGGLVLGLGLLFFGMNIMSEGMEPLRAYTPFLNLMKEMNNPLYAVVVAALFTAAVQSSSATIGIIIVMASNGFISLPAGIALAMGANIGTTITAMLASIGKSTEAKQTSLIHLLFNALAVIIWLPLIDQLSHWAIWIEQLFASAGELSQNLPREIAHANTLFNLLSLLLFLPFISVFVWAVNRLIPIEVESASANQFHTSYLDKSFVATPSVAMDSVELELRDFQKQQHLFYNRMVALVSEPNMDKVSRESANIQKFRDYEKEILNYMGLIGQVSLSPTEQQRHIRLITVMHNLQSMNQTMNHSIYYVINQMLEKSVKPSPTMLSLVGKLTNEVAKALDKSLLSVLEDSNEYAHEVIAMKSTINHTIQEALQHQLKQFKPDETRIMLFRYEMQLVEGFKQLFTLAKRTAHLQLEREKPLATPVESVTAQVD